LEEATKELNKTLRKIGIGIKFYGKKSDL